jgi:hypothetical protein
MSGKRLFAESQSGWLGLTVLILLLGLAGAVFITSGQASRSKISRDEITEAALAKAKQALLDYTLSRDDPDRPGEFPCPTQNAPGTTGYGDSPSSCAGMNLVGRLPWRKLGIPELTDESGEPLWYALSNSFKPVGSITTNSAITTDTRSNLVLLSANGSTIERDVVAIIFSPGRALENQDRSQTIRTCASTNLPANMCAANFLEANSVGNNAVNTGPFVSGPMSPTFNDRLSVIKTSDFFPQIEKRIAKDLETMINQYYVRSNTDPAKRFYPSAAYFRDLQEPPHSPTSNMRSIVSQAICANGVLAGRLPSFVYKNLPPPNLQPVSPSDDPRDAAMDRHTSCVGQHDWNDMPGTKEMPGWFYTNGWNSTIYYAVSKAFAFGGTKKCINPGDCLTLNGANVQAIVILPGIPTSSQARPITNNATAGLSLSNYLEEPANVDGWSASNDWSYSATTPTKASSDRLISFNNL